MVNVCKCTDATLCQIHNSDYDLNQELKTINRDNLRIEYLLLSARLLNPHIKEPKEVEKTHSPTDSNDDADNEKMRTEETKCTTKKKN